MNKSELIEKIKIDLTRPHPLNERHKGFNEGSHKAIDIINEALEGYSIVPIDSQEFKEAWARFSAIQHATYLVIDEDSMARFNLWKATGNDEDAWS